MKWLALWFLIFSAQAADTIKADIANLVSLEKRPYFQPHSDWVGIPMPSAPLAKIRTELEKRLDKKLHHTDAVVITAITPAEWRVLSQTLKMSTIEKILAQHSVMKSKIKVVCLKKFTAMVSGKTEESWFIALDSEDLYEFRQNVWHRFVTDGGTPTEFQWKRWSPHLTIGFTSPAMHDEERVTRETSECVLGLTDL